MEEEDSDGRAIEREGRWGWWGGREREAEKSDINRTNFLVPPAGALGLRSGPPLSGRCRSNFFPRGTYQEPLSTKT